MSCEVVREALPLLSGGDEAEAARVREHVEGCAPCREQMESYQADDAALGELRAVYQGAAPVMAGFSDELLDRIAHESRAQPRGQLLALTEVGGGGGGMRWLAAAAAVLLVVSTALVLRAPLEPAVDAGVVAEQPVDTPTQVVEEAAPQLASEDLAPLPAPSAADRAPMPARRVNRATNPDVLPADGRGRAPRGPGAMELEELMQRALPGLRRFFPPERPADRDGEVSF